MAVDTKAKNPEIIIALYARVCVGGCVCGSVCSMCSVCGCVRVWIRVLGRYMWGVYGGPRVPIAADNCNLTDAKLTICAVLYASARSAR